MLEVEIILRNFFHSLETFQGKKIAVCFSCIVCWVCNTLEAIRYRSLMVLLKHC